MEYPEEFSLKINKETVVILDNASIHKANIIRKRIPYWQHRGLFLYFPPPCSPHLNIAETIWRKLKKEWIVPEDYIEKETLFYATDRALANLGYELKINFKRFNTN
ncbi:hypothetical protein EZS27_030674 [termite gut metagenome]|uniref:Tc1-like transposase DDE domain-containing protein n=1 Tax=termite gut metagenome TaxID=433724 RepID=A0A5J4QEG7_9ZZZZ